VHEGLVRGTQLPNTTPIPPPLLLLKRLSVCTFCVLVSRQCAKPLPGCCVSTGWRCTTDCFAPSEGLPPSSWLLLPFAGGVPARE
jgi:hypothetical protein